MIVTPAIFVDILFAIFFSTSLFVDCDYFGAPVIVPIAMLLYQALKVWRFRGSIELAFLLLFSITYPLFWLLAVLLGVEVHYLFENVDARLVAKALAVQGLFLSCLFLGMRNSPPVIISQRPRRNSSVVFWFCIFAMMVCLAVAVSSVEGSIFEKSYDYELSGSSILFEYVLILIIIAYAYSGERRLRKSVLVLMSLLFVIAPLYFGKRLPASMVAFSLLLLYFRPKSLKSVGVIFLAGFFVLSMLAIFRVGESGQSILHVFLNIGDHGAMRNNQGGVVYSSAAYMKLVEQGVFDLMFGLQSLMSVVHSIFLPSSMVDQSAYINFSAMNYIPIPGNGGLPGVGFYVWGRSVAVVIMGLGFGWLMYRSRYSYLASVYVTFLFFTFPRWMAYNVNIMFKAGALLVIGWLLVRIVVLASRSNFGSPSLKD